MEFPPKISNEELYSLPLFEFTGDVVVIDTTKNISKYIEDILYEKYLGFDTETKPCFKKGKSNHYQVSLLQLSTSKATYLFRLNKIKLPKEIISCLSSEENLKIGLSTKDDLRALQKHITFEARGFLELQDYVKNFGIEDMSLRKIAAIVLGVRISKSQQLSNWEAPLLTEKQVRYAATDAWVCRRIYLKLKELQNDNT